MPVARFEMPDGRIARFEVAEGTTPEQAQSQIQALVDSQQPEEQGVIDTAIGAGEAALTVGSSILAEPIAGLAGLASLPFIGEEAGDVVRKTRESLTFDPATEEGRANLKSFANTLQPVTELLESAEKASGNLGFDIAGPVGGAIGTALPTAILEALGVGAARGGARAGGRVRDIARAEPSPRETSILETSERLDVPVLTSDISPPETFMGKFTASLSEKLGPLGSGSARASQQKARESAVLGLAEEMDIDLDSPFAEDIVKSLNRSSAQRLEKAGNQRALAVDSLNTFGEVPLTQTDSVINQQIAKQQRLRERADIGLIALLEDTSASLQQGNFEQLKEIRTEVISDLKAANRAEDTRRSPALQAVKSAIDKDMVAFARANDKQAAKDWLQSNREFARTFEDTRNTELKRILNAGDATPEKVIPILRGGKPSELKRLKANLTPKGIQSTQKAIIQDALKDSRFFDVDATPNPNAFGTALSKPNRQQAINVFFDGKAKQELDGMNRLLNATRRAQEASQVVKTGEQVVPIAAAAILAQFADSAVGVGAVTAASALAKAYESTRFRNLLIKLKNTKQGTPAETKALEAVVPAALAELQAAKIGQGQTEQAQ